MLPWGFLHNKIKETELCLINPFPSYMKLILPVGLVIFSFLFVMVACSKNQDSIGDRTIANIAGIYQLTGYTQTIKDTTYNTFDTLSACRKDNLVRLNTDMTVNFIDAGTPCSFPVNRTGSWRLADGYLYLDGNPLTIKNFNGTTLALTAISLYEPGVINFITWAKK
ncbi:MAG: lipocalin family protein [Chitinophagaceae bacterium]|nr:lipocalin family protein [Chitinophagaceae bacterium]